MARREPEQRRQYGLDKIMPEQQKQEDEIESQIDYSKFIEIEADEIARNGCERMNCKLVMIR
jgi:hypothetical protein